MEEKIEEETTRELLSCGRCGQVYVSFSQLKNHLETDCGKIKKFICHCGNRYLTEASLNQHRIIHEGQKRFLCDFCGKSFLSKGQLKIHERSHTKDKPFGCGVCNKRFAYRESLITHSSVHTGVKPYECQCCKKTFSCIGNLLKHKKTRPDTCGSKEYSEVKKIAPRPMTKNLAIPTIIEKKENHKINARTSKKKQNKNIRSHCISDNEEFQSESITLISTSHINIMNATEDEQNLELKHEVVNGLESTNKYENDFLNEVEEEFKPLNTNTDFFSSYVNIEDKFLACQLCPKIYKSIKVIFSHLKKEHQIEVDIGDDALKNFQASFKPQNETLTKNTETPFKHSEHHGKRSHMCLKCGRSFSSKTILSDHERSDCGSNPIYICDFCSKGYHSAGSLKTHISMHTGELNHVCPYCGKTFRTAGQVKIHSRKHTGEKPYMCSKCQKSFSHRESLLTHESIHSGVKRFMCKCGQRFSCISNLKAHRKSHKDSCGKFPLITKPVGLEKSISIKIVNNK